MDAPRRSARLEEQSAADEDLDDLQDVLELRKEFGHLHEDARSNLELQRQLQITLHEERSAFNARRTARLEAVSGAGQSNGGSEIEEMGEQRLRSSLPAGESGESQIGGSDVHDIAAKDGASGKRTAETTTAEKLQPRTDQFVASIRWDAVIAAASRARAGIRCQLGDAIVTGHFNLVRQIVFEDRVNWVVRLSLPSLPSVFGHREALDVESIMRSEIATTKLLRQKPMLPVPEVFAYDLNPNNEVGAPYMFMQFVSGTPAYQLAAEKGYEPGTFGTPAQNERFWQQVAGIHVELASMRFDQIGSLYEDGFGFKIGPEVETGKGPWHTAEEYYADLADHVYASANKDADMDVRRSESFDLPNLFPDLIKRYGKPHQKGSFGLVNRDFGPHIILVNDEFEITEIIDFDAVMAAPIECVAQLPAFMGLTLQPPGHVEVDPLHLATIEKGKLLVEKYVLAFEEAANRQRCAEVREVSKWLRSEAACIVKGLNSYAQHQVWVNEKWWAAYKTMLNAKDMV